MSYPCFGQIKTIWGIVLKGHVLYFRYAGVPECSLSLGLAGVAQPPMKAASSPSAKGRFIMCFRPPAADANGPIKCPKCGAMVAPTADECPKCGAKASPAPAIPGAPGMPAAPGAPGAPKPPAAPGVK